MPLQAIAGELAKIGDKAGFVSVRSAVANDLALDVAGVGRLRLPRAARCALPTTVTVTVTVTGASSHTPFCKGSGNGWPRNGKHAIACSLRPNGKCL